MTRTYKGDGLSLRRKTWWLDCLINGVRYQRKLGKGISRSVALDFSRKYRVEILSGNVGYGKKTKDPLFEEAVKKFETWMKANKKAHTIRSYARCLLELKKAFSGKRLSAMTTWMLETYKKRRGEGQKLGACPEGVSEQEWTRRRRVAERGAPVRANRELAVLKTLFNRCRDWGLYTGDNPVSKVKFRKEPRQRLRFVEPEEETRLLAACTDPLRTLILMCIHTGLRVHAEALTLTWASVDLKRNTLTVESAYAKNGKSRTVPLNSVAKAALAQLPRTGDRVFQHGPVGRAFRTACTKANLKGVTPHTLRHTFASRLVMSGADLKTVMELGGWSSIGMVERYSHLSPQHRVQAIERLANFHSAFHSASPEAVRDENAPAC